MNNVENLIKELQKIDPKAKVFFHAGKKKVWPGVNIEVATKGYNVFNIPIPPGSVILR